MMATRSLLYLSPSKDASWLLTVFPALYISYLWHLFCFWNFVPLNLASLMAQLVRNLPAMQETCVWSLGWEDSLEKGIGNPLQYSCLENPMDRGTWRATVHGVAESDTTERWTLSLPIYLTCFSPPPTPSLLATTCLISVSVTLFCCVYSFINVLGSTCKWNMWYLSVSDLILSKSIRVVTNSKVSFFFFHLTFCSWPFLFCYLIIFQVSPPVPRPWIKACSYFC